MPVTLALSSGTELVAFNGADSPNVTIGSPYTRQVVTDWLVAVMYRDALQVAAQTSGKAYAVELQDFGFVRNVCSQLGFGQGVCLDRSSAEFLNTLQVLAECSLKGISTGACTGMSATLFSAPVEVMSSTPRSFSDSVGNVVVYVPQLCS
jgi:hypothetical protein